MNEGLIAAAQALVDADAAFHACRCPACMRMDLAACPEQKNIERAAVAVRAECM